MNYYIMNGMGGLDKDQRWLLIPNFRFCLIQMHLFVQLSIVRCVYCGVVRISHGFPERELRVQIYFKLVQSTFEPKSNRLNEWDLNAT